jgi:hypothetical protein
LAKTIQAILNLKDNFSNTLKNTTNNTKQFQRQLKHVSNSVKDMQRAVMGSFGAIAGGIGLLEVGKQSLMLASDLEEVKNVIDTTFEGSASTINDWSQTALKSFGLSELTAKQFNGTLGAMLRTSGFTGDQLSSMTTNLSGLAGDVASFRNLKPEEAFEKLRSVVTGSSEPVEELGLDFRVASLEAYALSKGITKQWKDMSNAEQIQIRYNYTLEKLNYLQGDFARTGKGFAGSLKTAKESLKQLGGQIGSKALPLATLLLNKFNDFITIVPSLAQGFLNLFPNLSENFNNIYNTVVGIISGIIDNTIRIGSELSAPFMESFGAVIGFTKTVGGTIIEAFSSISQNIDMATLFNGIRDVLGGLLTDITNVFNFFNDNWGFIAPIISGITGTILSYNIAMQGMAIITKVVTALKVAWQGVTIACNIAMGLLNGTLTLTPLGWIILLIGGLIAIGVALWQNWDYISAKGQELWTSITSAFTSMGESIKGVWNDVKNSVGGFINYCIDGINSLIEGFNSLGGITIPDWVPGVGGNSFDLNIPTIPRFATGTQYFGGGLAEIGEHGGEIVNLPNGSQVIPADKTDKILNRSGGTIVNVTVQGNVIGNHQFVNEMGEIITGKIKLALSNN